MVVMDWAKQTVQEVERTGREGYSVFAFSPGYARTLVSDPAAPELLVFDAEKQGRGLLTEKLVNRYSGDGTLDDSVGLSGLRSTGTAQFAPGLIGQAFRFDGTNAVEGSGDATCWRARRIGRNRSSRSSIRSAEK
jgi:hypothetical protein